MTKNPHAVALGRKGGLAKVRKGFAAMPTAEVKRIRALATQRRADSRRLDAMIEHGLSVNIPVIPFGGGVATRGVFRGDDGPIAEAVDARDALDLAIAKLPARRPSRPGSGQKRRTHELS